MFTPDAKTSLRAPLLVRLTVVLSALIALFISLDVDAANPKRVLILHSYNRDFAPYDTIALAFRSDLARRSTEPITFIEANLDFIRAANDEHAHAFVEYLKNRFDDGPPDVVITIAAPAARFYLRHRDRLFPGTPVVLGSADERLLRQLPLRPEDAVVAARIQIGRLVDNILQLRPDTETIVVVVGASELERFWRTEVQRELAPYAGRVRFDYLDGLSLAQMQQRVASLPPRSAILYAVFRVDAAGVPYERQDGLDKLRATTNAPIFGVYQSELGNGVVGGPYLSQRLHGEHIASAALRALRGTSDTGPLVDVRGLESPVYDWRELERWKIDPARLPADGEIRFKPPTLWEEHRVAAVATAAALLLQALLIGALLVQRARRRRAERAAAGLAGRLVTAHEDERRRLARELHDDVTQRLAGLAIEAAGFEKSAASTTNADAAHSIREGLVELSEDVHALSYRLHPSVIEDLGLVEALRIECDRLTDRGSLRVNLDCRGVARRLPADAALCLFRVAQEALRNVERHAQAKQVDVTVAGEDGSIALTVRDDGAGFDAAGARERASLGLASMRERVRLLGGRLSIESSRGKGTSLFAWVPLPAAS